MTPGTLGQQDEEITRGRKGICGDQGTKMILLSLKKKDEQVSAKEWESLARFSKHTFIWTFRNLLESNDEVVMEGVMLAFVRSLFR